MRVTSEGLDAVATIGVHHGGVIVHDEEDGQVQVESSDYPVEINEADVALAPLDAPPTKSCGRRPHQAE